MFYVYCLFFFFLHYAPSSVIIIHVIRNCVKNIFLFSQRKKIDDKKRLAFILYFSPINLDPTIFMYAAAMWSS